MRQHPDDMLRRCDDREFAERQLGARDYSGQGPGDRRRQILQCVVHASHRSIVPTRRIFFCSISTPYRSASAVGGQPGT